MRSKVPVPPPETEPIPQNLSTAGGEESPKPSSVRYKKLADLTPDRRNANKGTARGNELIQASLRDYGAGRSILLDREGRIIAGNKTAENAGAAGMQDVIVVQTRGDQLVAVQRMDLDLETDPKAKALAVADNRASEVSLSWDTDVLKALQAEGEVDLTKFWAKDELVVFFAGPGELKTDPDDVPATPADPKAKVGDLYTLGVHRLLCGDSTKAEDVHRLMGGSMASCMWTDPPYGVSYVGKTAEAKTIQNDGAEGLEVLLSAAFGNADGALEPGSPIYVAHPPGALNVTFGTAFLAAGWRLHQTLIWDKGTMVLGHSDYHFSHEPIFYGYTPGAGRFGRGGKGWYGNDSQRSILEHPKPSRSESHPTMKPVALIEQCLTNSSAPGGAVLDLFGGSGSTIIACEKLSRRCFTMELDPIYVDVIVARWEAATGRQAVLHAS